MKIAIIGAGFAGLATAYFLLRVDDVQVTIFEKEKVGAGASGVCCGLMHPYPGFAARRSDRAKEAITLSHELFRFAQQNTKKIVLCSNGILRQSMNKEQHQRLQKHCKEFQDIEQIEKDLFFIKNGVTVHAENYLEGLSKGIFSLGVSLCIQKIFSIEELAEFDLIVLAAGFGITEFLKFKRLPIKFLKGQALLLKGTPDRKKSFISKGYVAYLQGEESFTIGSTYEREFANDFPHIDQAKELLKEKLQQYSERKILDCRAGVRVMAVNSYLPMIERVAQNVYALTGFGSRGLLYHALYGSKMAKLASSFQEPFFSLR